MTMMKMVTPSTALFTEPPRTKGNKRRDSYSCPRRGKKLIASRHVCLESDPRYGEGERRIRTIIFYWPFNVRFGTAATSARVYPFQYIPTTKFERHSDSLLWN